MSHKATNWAIEQRGLKPSAKLVLWHLADRHNPDNGCFPSQDCIAADCEMSRSSVNVQLNTLETAGLIKRQPRLDPKTKRQIATRYILAFEVDFASAGSAKIGGETELCPESGHGAVSRKQPEPCPENEQSRVQNLDTNLVREPVRETCAVETDGAEIDAHFEKFWQSHPKPKNRAESKAKFEAAVQAGVCPLWILQSARRYAVENLGNKPMYIAYSDNWLNQSRWTDFPAPAENKTGSASVVEEAALFWSGKINAGRFVSPCAISPAIGRLMLDRGLVTPEKLRSAGIQS